MNKTIMFLGMLAVGFANAQQGNVGINTDAPKATLEVQPTATNLAGTTNEGIIASKLSKTRVAAIATPVEGTLVYVTDDTASTIASYTGGDAKVAKIDEKGYYYFDGTEWVKTSNEWIYDESTKRINLKRSGKNTFKNKVYYNAETGQFINQTGEQKVVFDKNSDTNVTRDISSVGFRNHLFVNSKTLESNQKRADVKELYIDEPQSNNTFYFRTNANSLYLAPTNLAPTGWSMASSSDVTKADEKNTSHLFASTNNLSIQKGLITGYASALRNETLLDSNVDNFTGLVASTYNAISVGDRVKKVSNVNSVLSFIHILSNSSAQINHLSALNFNVQFWDNSRANITNLYGFKYDGIRGKKEKYSTTVTNHYGIYLDGISGATNNYALYTNSGKVRLGDLAQTGVVGDRAVYVDANGVLKAGIATASTGATQLSGTDGIECKEENRGKMNFKKGEDGKSDVFGVCLKNANGSYNWAYLVGGHNPHNGTGIFGSGL